MQRGGTDSAAAIGGHVNGCHGCRSQPPRCWNAAVRWPPGYRWLLIRRTPRTGELAFFRCYQRDRKRPAQPYNPSDRPMISFMISLVPPNIDCARLSAQARATGYSRI